MITVSDQDQTSALPVASENTEDLFGDETAQGDGESAVPKEVPVADPKKEIDQEAFTHISGKKTYVNIDHSDLFPYLLVNIGSGVSIIKVTGNKKFKRVTGTQFGGGTIFGFASLLTNCQSYDELLEISQHGDNRALDLTVGDIYGDTGYPELRIL
ncbi:pantothenate kinase 1-like [Quercus lobata]|uniref:pantothenate kinase 1-like n=1 Tax=Quercus lobata TaxID=97700 RepID=UPI001245044E|nr:pantothenate kinase 1-like [Quercus lobata]